MGRDGRQFASRQKRAFPHAFFTPRSWHDFFFGIRSKARNPDKPLSAFPRNPALIHRPFPRSTPRFFVFQKTGHPLTVIPRHRRGSPHLSRQDPSLSFGMTILSMIMESAIKKILRDRKLCLDSVCVHRGRCASELIYVTILTESTFVSNGIGDFLYYNFFFTEFQESMFHNSEENWLISTFSFHIRNHSFFFSQISFFA